MIPFGPYIPNQFNSQCPPQAPLQVPGNPNNMMPNLMQFSSPMGFMNTQMPQPFNNVNPNMGNANRPPMLMNVPNNAPQTLLGSAPMLPNQIQPHGGSGPPSFRPNMHVPTFPADGKFSGFPQGSNHAAQAQLNQGLNQAAQAQLNQGLNQAAQARLYQGLNHAAQAQLNQGLNQAAQAQPNLGPNQAAQAQLSGQLFAHNSMNMVQQYMAQQLNQNVGFQNGQMGWQNQVQGINQPNNLSLLNPTQIAALNQLMGLTNQVGQAMAPQNTGLSGDQQLGMVQPNIVLQQSNLGQPNLMAATMDVSKQLPAPAQHTQGNFHTVSNSSSSHLHYNQSPNFQGNHGKKNEMHTSNMVHNQNRNSIRNPKASNWRFQNQQNHNVKGKHKFNGNDGKGTAMDMSTNFRPDKSANQSKGGKKRSLAMFYTQQEIQQWREERKKNYPSQVNIKKKLADKQVNSEAADERAKLRRQQLKDVLAKQAELGFEVPEIPSHYLSDSETKTYGKDKGKKGFKNNGRFQNRYNKRGRFNRDDRLAKPSGFMDKKRERFAKKQRLNDDSLKTRQPTLLQKLLSTDTKRDKTRLLQAFRFMVMNSFFEEWPGKPLSFPRIIVRETQVENDIIEEKTMFSNGGGSGDSDDEDGGGRHEDGHAIVGISKGKQEGMGDCEEEEEEGEITE